MTILHVFFTSPLASEMMVQSTEVSLPNTLYSTNLPRLAIIFSLDITLTCIMVFCQLSKNHIVPSFLSLSLSLSL